MSEYGKSFYRLKKPALKFFCALCRAPREMRYRKKLTKRNYLQIAVLSVFLSWVLFPVMKEKSLFLFFIVWASFEIVNKILYRRELPCPHCGFDATWYKRDIKVTRKKVEEYFKQNSLETENQRISAQSHITQEQDNWEQSSY